MNRYGVVGIEVIVAAGMLISTIGADQVATTEDGKKVILRENGTWKLATKADLRVLQAESAAAAEQTSKSMSGGPVDKVKTPHVSLVKVVGGDKDHDFRKARWGMTTAQVKQAETARFVSGNTNTIEYSNTLAGLKCRIIYEFESGSLVRAGYKIEQDHFDPQVFYEDFQKLTGFLTTVYGTPGERNYDWKNEMYKRDRTKWGFAISIGFLSCRVIWGTGRSKIDLKISGGKHTFNTTIQYAKT